MVEQTPVVMCRPHLPAEVEPDGGLRAVTDEDYVKINGEMQDCGARLTSKAGSSKAMSPKPATRRLLLLS